MSSPDSRNASFVHSLSLKKKKKKSGHTTTARGCTATARLHGPIRKNLHPSTVPHHHHGPDSRLEREIEVRLPVSRGQLVGGVLLFAQQVLASPSRQPLSPTAIGGKRRSSHPEFSPFPRTFSYPREQPTSPIIAPVSAACRPRRTLSQVHYTPPNTPCPPPKFSQFSPVQSSTIRAVSIARRRQALAECDRLAGAILIGVVDSSGQMQQEWRGYLGFLIATGDAGRGL